MSDNDDGGGDDDDSLLLEGSHIDSETQAPRVGQALSPADLCTFASVRAVGAVQRGDRTEKIEREDRKLAGESTGLCRSY